MLVLVQWEVQVEQGEPAGYERRMGPAKERSMKAQVPANDTCAQETPI
jgi:hypothetical protein